MLRVRTRIAASTIHGVGLFADEPIAAGTLIWSYDPHFDVAFDTAKLATLATPARELVRKYSYFDAAIGTFILCGDDARFMNHSNTPNTAEVPGSGTIAAREIAPGEELTCNYAELGLPTFR